MWCRRADEKSLWRREVAAYCCVWWGVTASGDEVSFWGEKWYKMRLWR